MSITRKKDQGTSVNTVVSNSGKKPVMITQDPLMLDLYRKVKLAAKTNVSVLITGENGTGKEVLAGLLHYHSARSKKDMVVVNCGAIPNELVESELLGHERGAFTGAVSLKKGCFEMADQSTLFLDEIGEMSLSAQVKLLRAVESGSFRRVGGKDEINVDVNLITATNKTLSEEVIEGNFREDLYYRLNVVELQIPPLRHRKADIPLLLEFYKNHFQEKYEVEEIEFDGACIELLLEYDWPGNVRELKNTVERCSVLHEGKIITEASLPASILKKEKKFYTTLKNGHGNYLQIPLGISMEEVERHVINHTLRSVDNNKTEAAKVLGFARKTLHNKLDKYELENL